MSNKTNDIWNEQQAEISMERFDEAIRQIKAHNERLKAIDAKIAEKKKLIEKTGVINLCDIGILFCH